MTTAHPAGFAPRPRTNPLLDQGTQPDGPQFGTWVKLPSLETVEILAHTGYHFIVIDNEHSPLNLESTYAAISLSQALGMGAFVRVPDRSGALVQRVLDAGADGIFVPQVANAQLAAEATAPMVFTADGGSRGMGATSRAGLWGLRSRDAYLDHGRNDIARVVQLEERAALEKIEAILDVATVNAVLIGLGDLSLSTGLAASDPLIEDLVDRVLAAAQARKMACGTAVADATAAAAAARRGYSFVLVSNDASMFAREAQNTLRSVRQQLEPPSP